MDGVSESFECRSGTRPSVQTGGPMFEKGSQLWFRLAAGGSGPALLVCEVQDIDARACRVVFPAASPPLVEGMEALLFFDLGARFMQQLVRVRALHEVEPRVVLTLELRSAPVPARHGERPDVMRANIGTA